MMVFFLFCHLWRWGFPAAGGLIGEGTEVQDPTRWLQGVGTQQCRGPWRASAYRNPPTAPTKRSVPERRCGGLTDHLECQGGCNYHLFLHTKEVFNAKHPNRRVFTSGPLAGCGGLFLCGREGDSQLPLKAERALTAPACSPPIAERAAPSVRANGDRDPGQVHLRGAAQGVHFGKKPGPGRSPLTLQNLSTFSFFMCGFS